MLHVAGILVVFSGVYLLSPTSGRADDGPESAHAQIAPATPQRGRVASVVLLSDEATGEDLAKEMLRRSTSGAHPEFRRTTSIFALPMPDAALYGAPIVPSAHSSPPPVARTVESTDVYRAL